MTSLIYAAITSLDGYVADADGGFDWAAPDEEVHAFCNDLDRPVGTHLLGRRMHAVLSYWDTAPTSSDEPVLDDFARIWRASDKVVYSTTLESVTAPRTRLERTFDPGVVRRLKDEATRDLSIGGPTLAAEALRSGLVDEIHLLVNPVVVGGGTRALPDDLHLDLALVDTRRFTNGVVHLHHRVLS